MNAVMSRQKFLYSFTVLAGVFTWFLVKAILDYGVLSDIPDHARSVQEIILGSREVPGNFLFFEFVAALAFFLPDFSSILFNILVVVAFSVALKYYLAAKLFAPETGKPGFQWTWFVVAFFLLFASPLPSMKQGAEGFSLESFVFLVGKIPLNNWHNSTLILSIPFSIWVYSEALAFLRKQEVKSLLAVLTGSILVILIKPSFFLAFAPVFLIFACYRLGWGRHLGAVVAVLFLGFSVLATEFFSVYKPTFGAAQSSIAMAPFSVWEMYSDNFLRDSLLSFAFPLSIIFIYFKEIRGNFQIWFSWALMGFAILIFIFVVETGIWAHHGNFSWQNIPCNFMLFLTGVSVWFNLMQNRGWIGWKDMILMLVFALHVLSGFLYLQKIFITGSCWGA